MGKRQTARNVRGEPVKRSIESVQNDQRQLPAEVAALFNDLLSRSRQAAHADDELQTKVDEANAKFRQEQARLMNSLAQQLGVSATVKELTVLRERHVRTVSDAMEKAHSAAGVERPAAGRDTRKTKARMTRSTSPASRSTR